jgi:hypothetical protein
VPGKVTKFLAPPHTRVQGTDNHTHLPAHTVPSWLLEAEGIRYILRSMKSGKRVNLISNLGALAGNHTSGEYSNSVAYLQTAGGTAHDFETSLA